MVQWAANKDKSSRFWMKEMKEKEKEQRIQPPPLLTPLFRNDAFLCFGLIISFLLAIRCMSFCLCSLLCLRSFSMFMMMVLMFFVICQARGHTAFFGGETCDSQWNRISSGGTGGSNNKNNIYNNTAFQLWSRVPVCSLYFTRCLGALDTFSRRLLFVSWN